MSVKDGYTKNPMYKDKYEDWNSPIVTPWKPPPVEKQGKVDENHERRIRENDRNENTR
jgi:hypothetical protein